MEPNSERQNCEESYVDAEQLGKYVCMLAFFAGIARQPDHKLSQSKARHRNEELI